MNCYFYKHIPLPPASVTLDQQESFHATTSRRQQSGDSVILIDGKGTLASGVIDGVSRSAVKVQIQRCSQAQRQKPTIILAAALPKGGRQKTMLNMITQLGVAALVPLACKRSIVNPNSVNISRWASICLQACKQSHNPFLPRIEESAAPVEFVQKMGQRDISVLVADPAGSGIASMVKRTSVAICIGPEGGFSDCEKDGMLTAGAEFFSLGRNILRIETAAVASVSIVCQFCPT